MSKEMEELMQKSIISENIELSEFLSDIVPIKENRFTDIELEVAKKEEFSIVVYKKQGIIKRISASIRMIMEKLNIIKHSNEFVLEKIPSRIR